PHHTPPDLYSLSLHDALPICSRLFLMSSTLVDVPAPAAERLAIRVPSGGHTVEVVAPLTGDVLTRLPVSGPAEVAAAYDRARAADRKSTRLNSSHLGISYAVF